MQKGLAHLFLNIVKNYKFYEYVKFGAILWKTYIFVNNRESQKSFAHVCDTYILPHTTFRFQSILSYLQISAQIFHFYRKIT